MDGQGKEEDKKEEALSYLTLSHSETEEQGTRYDGM